jgi:hypothetical protein
MLQGEDIRHPRARMYNTAWRGNSTVHGKTYFGTNHVGTSPSQPAMDIPAESRAASEATDSSL